MPTRDRVHTIDAIRARLAARGSPRLQMSVIIAITGAAGFLASYALLHAGMTRMIVRYPTSVGIAYAVFLGCLWYWLRRHRLRVARREAKARRSDWIEVLDVSNVPFSFGSPSIDAPEPVMGGGGGFSGAGGGSSWSESGVVSPPAPRAVQLSAKQGGGKGGSGFDLDLDDGGVVLVVLAIAAAVAVGAGLYVVYIAPALFAELLLDAALSAGLYRRVRGMDHRSWMRTAFARTVVPVIVVALTVAAAGYVAQRRFPGAISIGRVVERAMTERATR
jgi:hypothetical protein